MKKTQFNKIYNIDCIKGMSSLEPKKIDLIITDPPFAINFKSTKPNYNRTASRVMKGYNEIKREDYYDFTYSWMSEAYRILKESVGLQESKLHLCVILLKQLEEPCLQLFFYQEICQLIFQFL